MHLESRGSMYIVLILEPSALEHSAIDPVVKHGRKSRREAAERASSWRRGERREQLQPRFYSPEAALCHLSGADPMYILPLSPSLTLYTLFNPPSAQFCRPTLTVDSVGAELLACSLFLECTRGSADTYTLSIVSIYSLSLEHTLQPESRGSQRLGLKPLCESACEARGAR